MADHHVFAYRGSFEFPAAPGQTWDMLEQTHHYENWWPWMRDLRVRGEPLTNGTCFSFTVVAPIPFKMHLEVEISDSREPEHINAVIRGDLAGRASMSFEPSADGGTASDIEWTVEVVEPRMRAAAPVIRPLLLWGQNWAVEMGLRGFRRHLDES
jgi:uncharacterized protein YndB with AHSA1/START domain